MGYWDMLAKREEMKQKGMLMARDAFARNSREEVAGKMRGLMGQAEQPAVLGELGRFTTQLQPTQAAEGWRGSDQGIEAQQDFMIGAMQAGIPQQQALGILSPSQSEAISAPDRFKMSQDLAKQRTKALQPYVEMRSQTQKTMTALQQGTGAGDLAAVISFNKSLDPTSVVRESEQKATTGAAGPIERLRGLIGEVEGKGGLSDTSRQQMAALIVEIQANEAAYANNILTDYNQRAKSFDLKPSDIRGGQLGYDAQGQPRTDFRALDVPESLIPLPPGAREI